MFERIKKSFQNKARIIQEKRESDAAVRAINSKTLELLEKRGILGALVVYEGKTHVAKLYKKDEFIALYRRYGMKKGFSSEAKIIYYSVKDDGVLISSASPYSQYFNKYATRMDIHTDEEEQDEIKRLCFLVELMTGEIRVVGAHQELKLMDYIHNTKVFDEEKGSIVWGYHENGTDIYVPFHAIKKYSHHLATKEWLEAQKENFDVAI
uniref:Uncharacterized protein n=1 Tax=Ochrobactrum phage ORM_20 TaxID=2985243 RepID=A0A9N6WS26_9VIRU|nr:hypothetical protein ORM20_00105 [Ochrobactrum phage ORM_20]